MAYSDDHWVRLFNVSDPRRAYAGHTLYKVTSKVFQREFPEGATEIAVWRRFSDFKKLHHELLKIYIHNNFKEKQFPHFPKAKYFGRFEEGVVEERRKAALELLNFAGNIEDLFTSQPFVKFFEGAFPDNANRSDSVASREASSSETGDSPSYTNTIDEDGISDGAVPIEPPVLNSSDKENGDSLDDATLGGVWLYKQPSLTEGLDNLTSDEEEEDCQEASETALTIEGRKSDMDTHLKSVEDHDDVFVYDDREFSESETGISEREEGARSADPPKWLVRAISICSEGEDLETLASEADSEDLSFPQAFSDYSYCGGHQRRSDGADSSKTHEGDYLHNPQSDSLENREKSWHGLSQNEKTANSSSFVHKVDNQGVGLDSSKISFPETSTAESESRKSNSDNTSVASKGSLNGSGLVNQTEGKQSFTSSSDSVKAGMRQRTISDLGNIYIDPKESDYLYAAGHTIHKALDCEVNGRYEEAFGLYRSCVGLLLSGVQGEKDVKRREAVRRKTAQYLLKAEALYNSYLACKELSENSEQESVPSHSGNSVCESDDLEKFKDLTLADLKVMGIVGKVILVENIHNGETYVVKALRKSGPIATRTHGQSHGNERRRRKSLRRIYGKYPNIVRLYRFFETANTIYLLLEYAQGGRLWDHISCYRSHKESLDYVTGKPSQRIAQGGNKLNDHSEKKVVANDCTAFENRLAPEVLPEPLAENLKGRTSRSLTKSRHGCGEQDSEVFATNSCASFEETKPKTNVDGDSIPCNGDNNKSVSDRATRINKESMDNCGKKTSGASPDDKHFLFKKLDEYFASSVQHVPNEHVKIWAAEIVLAVAYLHTAGTICRDLNPRNVLLDEDGHVLLTYFGSWEETEHALDEEAMHRFYCAPEIWQVDEVTAAADWWSVGALLYEMITGQALSTAHPWGLKTHTELQLPNKISPEARSLLKELLRVLPSERLGSGVNGVEEIKAHPFFSGVNWAWLCSRIN